MKIRTTGEIMISNPVNVEQLDKKWVSVEDIKNWLTSHSFGYREHGFNVVDADELMDKLDNTNEK